MIKIAVYTLVDITATGIKTNIAVDEFKRNQQRNWETASQVVNLRYHNIIEAAPFSPKYANLTSHNFGSQFQQQHSSWKFIFSTESESIITDLEYDFDNVPVIAGLNETIELNEPVFRTHGAWKNIYFKILPTKD
jgi:hypothetical protein